MLRRMFFSAMLLVTASSASADDKPITFHFRDADLRKVLTQLAELRGKNIVFTDEVQGKVTIDLSDVPVDQAFRLILRQKSLFEEEDTGVIIIRPLK